MTTFELKPEHIALLSHAYIRWEDVESGAPSIDPKRPYGNSGRRQICNDIRDALGIESEECPSCGYTLDTELSNDEAWKLHKETETALQIILSCKTFEPGTFKKTEAYNARSWERVEDG